MNDHNNIYLMLNIHKYIKFTGCIAALMGMAMLNGCKEDIDTSARYVFTEETIGSYLQKQPAYSEYVALLKQVKEVRLSADLGSHPAAMVPEAGMSFEMEKYMKRANPEFAFSVGRVLELNAEHEAVKAMVAAMTEDPLKAKDYAQLLMYQAQLMAQLPIEDPVAYTELVCKLMK